LFVLALSPAEYGLEIVDMIGLSGVVKLLFAISVEIVARIAL
jgi:hypothetical protein